MADEIRNGTETHRQTPQDRKNARVGLWLFALYLTLYAGFMTLNVASPATIAQPSLGGFNLAIVYGFGLIGSALLLALVYMIVCRRRGETP